MSEAGANTGNGRSGGGEPLPDRERLLARRQRVLVVGRATKADVWLTTMDDGTAVVVKEFRHRSRWISAFPPLTVWGRTQIRREAKFLRLLGDVPQVPRFLGFLSRDAFVMSYVEGRPLLACSSASERSQIIEQLQRFLDTLHQRGIVHLDLRNRENARVDAAGQVTFIDWASAIHLPPGSVLHAFLFRALRAIDVSAVIKWKQLLAPESITPEDVRFLRRFRWWRRLWPLNRKGLGQIGEP